MPAYHAYLISSLPMLHFGAKPPFSTEKFLTICSELISAQESEILKTSLNNDTENYNGSVTTLKKWREFEIALRNELVKIRSSRKHIDPSKFLRKDGYTDLWISHIAISAHRNQSVIDAEKELDRARWRLLDDLLAGHYFDIDFLIVYGQKLLILEKWEKIRTANAGVLLEEALSVKDAGTKN